MTLRPNILVTGTPGTGKSVTSRNAAELTNLKYINVGEFIKENECFEGKDEEYDSYILDEDKLIDLLDPIVSLGGYIIDFHSCEIFPERWFDLVLVLHSNTEILYDRLVERNYSTKKINENMECEIMQVVSEAARESYDKNIVYDLDSNNIDDLESNVNRIKQWYENWLSNNN